MTRAELIERMCRRYAPGDLDSHVHELKAQEAAALNNDGVEAQVDYMIKEGGLSWVKNNFLGGSKT
jgi:hypothetical protein